eukprot:scaffold4976_cov161-Amphora_coffeaeformis.AAC.11
MKWGDSTNLQDYYGRRDFGALSKFAKENLKPVCSPRNMELCNDEKKKQIQDFRTCLWMTSTPKLHSTRSKWKMLTHSL